ncbi:hypothetical protein M0L20_10850 [Spirosoma sp. RP8]|uniref:RloB domain-containing protein n=1 Tax=Spirosoma liriopis TaxID=2937440 RepID=A0ABT0HJK7_9BACT|nr:hypothetical protein [Spirosoma liriopis]MCK8492349.1 hypothetical protein [Spirosoma liriopis]
MSKTIRYGILCEDRAHRNFIEYYLGQCHPGLFEESQPFGWAIRASNAREVEDSIPDATRKGFTNYGLDLLFIGRDTDSTDSKKIDVLKSKLSSLCSGHPKVVFMMPVQCIEHWLLYLQWHKTNPTSTKNESFEQIMRIEAKQRVYGGKLKVDKQLELANKLLVNLDVDWLEQRSNSFKHFHQQVKAFVSQQ